MSRYYLESKPTGGDRVRVDMVAGVDFIQNDCVGTNLAFLDVAELVLTGNQMVGTDSYGDDRNGG